MAAKEFLEHHGIKGMHWGIRNKVNPKTGRVSGDHRVVSDLKVRPKHSLTNRQLQTVNTRLNLEQSFDRLNPGKIKKGEKHIRAVVATAGLISSVAAIANSPLGKPIMELINRNKGKIVKIKPGTSFT